MILRILILILIISAWHTAAEVHPMLLNSEPTHDEWAKFVSAIKDAGSGSWFLAAFMLVQSLFLLCRTVFGEFLGVYKLLVLAFLSVIVTIGTNITAGKSIFESLFLDAGSLMSYQVLFYQFWSQWKKREEDRRWITTHPKPNRLRRRTEDPKA